MMNLFHCIINLPNQSRDSKLSDLCPIYEVLMISDGAGFISGSDCLGGSG